MSLWLHRTFYRPRIWLIHKLGGIERPLPMTNTSVYSFSYQTGVSQPINITYTNGR